MEMERIIKKFERENNKDKFKKMIAELFNNESIDDNKLSNIYYRLVRIIETKFNVNLDVENLGLEKVYNLDF